MDSPVCRQVLLRPVGELVLVVLQQDLSVEALFASGAPENMYSADQILTVNHALATDGSLQCESCNLLDINLRFVTVTKSLFRPGNKKCAIVDDILAFSVNITKT